MRLALLPLLFDLRSNYVLCKSMTYEDFHRAKSLIIAPNQPLPPGNRPRSRNQIPRAIPQTRCRISGESELSPCLSDTSLVV